MVQCQTGDNDCQPSAQVGDLAGIGAVEPEPGFLHGIVRFVDRTKNARCDRSEPGSFLFKSRC